ncbi:4'-phosphopantetheinyl transferase family protein [Paenibacillus radicis (ex Gao et al. 2016)]|uniref:Surfactin biosynthesis protein Sfp n=1 Tax=Paenibacillus radicis (ex Gao et al. 2016) TaxID=1737354 RepID=A0A917HNR2_9BACL|nr:4'-phosphopantetheinyl transferase superfamily protein [Paenibacillus radicis (ex Gao et al. 2016)]GGG85705.1 surfactin biosynthesis protein Sfp [Paenibacillus radicis (ex Gao et al. 2016)]
MLHLYYLKMDREMASMEREEWLPYVSEERRERIARFHSAKDAQRSLFGELLARYALCENTGRENSELKFIQNQYGKPKLEREQDEREIYFNLSHSGQWVVCAVDYTPVGIDVEEIKPISLEIARRFFAKDEYEALLREPEISRQQYFYALWTMKESFIKADGRGLSLSLDQFSIDVAQGRVQYQQKWQNSRLWHSQLDEEHMLAVCASPGIHKTMQHFTLSEFVRIIADKLDVLE